jgi:hypothetical protein
LHISSFVTAAAIMIYSSSGSAQTAPPKTAAPAKSLSRDPDAKICRIEDVTGSHFTTKTCHTRREWAAVDDDNAADKERIFRMRRGYPGRMEADR